MSSIGSTPSLVVGIAAGAAASAALEPALEIPKQQAWADAPNRLPDVALIARLYVTGQVSKDSAYNMAARLGFDKAPFDALAYLAQETPEFPLVLRLWRLFGTPSGLTGNAGTDLVDHALAHSGLDWDYHALMRDLYDAELPGIGDIAYAVQRGIINAPAYLPVKPPQSGFSINAFPSLNIDPEELAAKLGYSKDMLHLMIGRSGLSMAPVMAAQANFRKLINDNDYLLAIAQGDLRTEWAQTVKDASREIPTLGQMMEHALRGFSDIATAKTNATRHGASDTDAQLVYDNLGRAPNIHAVNTGLARGGTYDGQPKTIPEPYLSAVQRADIRPEWYDIEYANRYTYPSAFVMRALAQAGDIGDAAAVEQVLLEIGWKPSFAKSVAAAWTGGGTKADTHTAKAQTQLWTATHKSYLGYEISDATATASLSAAGVDAATIPAVINLWKTERDLIRKSLSATNIKKAWTEQTPDPTTGQPWTEQEAVNRLLELGYDSADATMYLTL